MHLSVVIPAYNEEDRIIATMERVLAYLAEQPYDTEVIVVNDGSEDRTAEVVEGFRGGDHPGLRLVTLPRNRGKGYAVRLGMLDEASGSYRVFYDADGSAPIEELAKLWPHFEDGADIVIGSRALPDSDVQVHQAWYRETMGRIFNLMLRGVRLTHFKDTQCGFKGFTARACEVVFTRQSINHFGFDAELLYIAQHHGLRIDEVPVRWINSASSRVHPITDSADMLLDMLRICFHAFAGRYR